MTQKMDFFVDRQISSSYAKLAANLTLLMNVIYIYCHSNDVRYEKKWSLPTKNCLRISRFLFESKFKWFVTAFQLKPVETNFIILCDAFLPMICS